MKVLQISDSHLTSPGQWLHGSDPLERLRQLLEHAGEHHGDANGIILTGDLTHRGEAAAYQALGLLLQEQRLPVHLMLGNHDRRDMFRQCLPHHTHGTLSFLQYVLVHGQHRLLLLDTLDEGKSSGHLCPARLSWLQAQLEAAGSDPVYLFMHHPPFEVGMAPLDNCRLDNADALHAVLAAHGNVRHLFCGHVHRHISGCWRGLPFSTVKGSNHQTALRLGQATHAHSGEAPGYSVILADESSVVVHYQDVACP
ncbi:phosphodiesterase [Kerstersia similis]|uniref:phosphodiesterase n=1 Tax=Kerstersia similis TaxID=206505 RepID=UPI0039F02DBC